jgi:hypothetical protein
MIYNCIFENNESDSGGGIGMDMLGIFVAESNIFIKNKAFEMNLIASCSGIILVRSVRHNILQKNIYFLNMAENKGTNFFFLLHKIYFS